ncbi:serine-pyruvate aminotransferase/aspartate aminotransferase [Clostridium aceticum]|uniref:Serine-pyruvate aminotransferase/aspartate aminotransferase n=1 Tax=Clostridium aceticum TaxID=84022 RepID=A0A0D8IH00_9CLOT|nr:alanine--glyoxylate aminotransferase family protein [Clostridium aceticum]AKL94229.1 serine-pyruvate aminotransferase/aspartate aminotransferase [Clostridium aceticum]KJF28436.1 serine-pyruvate aminotransferase/archaeal aspartate aminotransferase [Clostridium aceticum]
MKTPLIMTPGPTYVSEEVRRALSREITNPDLDLDFYEFYKETCHQIKKLLNTKNDVLILSGEGILGLEAACASLIEDGDKVLVIDNGIFGKGFGDFAKMYGGEVQFFQSDYESAIDVDKLEKFLEENHDFKLATLVHCETPSGITNPIEVICPMLKKYGIITVVDAVSSVGGETLNTDAWKIDMVLGGSQKVLSAPPGLTFLSISEEAWGAISNRRTPIIGYYCNLAIWKNWYEDQWFPYTQPVSDLYAIRAAVDMLLEDKEALERHRKIAEALRKSLKDAGIQLYAKEGFSNTVTTFMVPEGITFRQVYEDMLKNHGIMIAGAFDFLKDRVIRIGHMGENCYEEKVYSTLKALDQVFRKYNIPLRGELHKLFVEYV